MRGFFKNLSIVLVFSIVSTSAFSEMFEENMLLKNKRHKSVGGVWQVDSNTKVKRARSVIKRRHDSICITTKTHSLPSGAYTNWWVIYNEPEYCSNPSGFGDVACGPDDVPNPLVRATVMLATGSLVGPDGKARFNTCLETGELTFSVFPMGTQEGLVNSRRAEIQQVIRYHGPAEYDFPALLGLQLSEFGGGCEDDSIQQPGFECFDAQMITHVPVPYGM